MSTSTESDAASGDGKVSRVSQGLRGRKRDEKDAPPSRMTRRNVDRRLEMYCASRDAKGGPEKLSEELEDSNRERSRLEKNMRRNPRNIGREYESMENSEHDKMVSNLMTEKQNRCAELEGRVAIGCLTHGGGSEGEVPSRRDPPSKKEERRSRAPHMMGR